MHIYMCMYDIFLYVIVCMSYIHTCMYVCMYAYVYDVVMHGFTVLGLIGVREAEGKVRFEMLMYWRSHL